MQANSPLLRFAQPLLLCLLVTPAVVGWAKSTVSVSVHGVNYSNQTFSYSLEDPNDKKNRIGGELVDRFAAGGTQCCYELPRQWRPGIKIQVNSRHWLPKEPDGKLPEVAQTHVVEVPEYADGKPGELWVLRQPDGTVKIVSSDYQPDHEKWPGEVKGWPVPSLEYRRERHALYLELAESDVKSVKRLLSDLQQDPAKSTALSWELRRKYSPLDLTSFSGPSDPKFRDWLQKEYEQSLQASENKALRLRESQQ
ncbi:DUF3304 domain-containing protein [Pseudoduganella namucuonensis]|uniref:DUF3304 domain-containing protein n=1 Tax=Pseudoduganella namucuonensis TaxID=1035707 RepID=A0A1I7F5Z6_9BURK|nr:DUF3304 domain-containing protein [Pseudoduganella namucuonensis]SFU31584.1 Protein of unknown function [Pseudoduganella namucuonensis]